jgi:hypothetical protein
MTTSREERTVSFNLTLQYDKVLFMLEPSEITRPLARQRVMIYDYPDGHFAIKHQGRTLPYKIFDKLRQVDQAAIVENKLPTRSRAHSNPNNSHGRYNRLRLNRAALHPAYPIECRTSTQKRRRPKASTPKELPPLTH